MAHLPSPGAGASIEQSVRTFRLYEALRSGDTAAISKSIREGSASKGDARTSSSSLTAGLDGTSILHLAVQCADVPVIEYVLSNGASTIDVNARDKEGNTPLHIAAMLNRGPVVHVLLNQLHINDKTVNHAGKTPLDLAKNPEVFQQLQLANSLYIDASVKRIQELVSTGNYEDLEKILVDAHFQSAVDVNGGELATDPATIESGGTLLHEAARKRDARLIQVLLLNGADPFQRDRKGKLPQDVTKDDRTRGILKKSPAAAVAQRGIQEKTILGSNPAQSVGGPQTGENALGGKEGREMKGYLKKWTNYTSGYKLRWFVLEDGVLSYYKHQDDAGSACRGAINMKIARLHMDAQDKLRFEIHGKSSVRYHLKANHQVEAKRWFWALNNAIQFTKDEAKEDAKKQTRSNEMLRQAIERTASARDPETASLAGSTRGGNRNTIGQGISRTFTQGSTHDWDEDDGQTSIGEQSAAGDDVSKMYSRGTTAVEGGIGDDEDFPDDASEIDVRPPVAKDAFVVAAHSARLQLDLLAQISTALQGEKARNPKLPISEPTIVQALASFEAGVSNLNELVGNLSRIARDREGYWSHRLDQEINVRRVWEDSMAKVAREQEDLERQIGESEDKRKRTKRALKEALEGQMNSPGEDHEHEVRFQEIEKVDSDKTHPDKIALPPRNSSAMARRRKSTIAEMTSISDSDSDDAEEFFDAVDEGKVEIMEEMPPPILSPPLYSAETTAIDGYLQDKKDENVVKHKDLSASFKGYEEPVRKRLKLDADNRPKISLWGILKSMIGKDMTKMTLPVSFNEPTSLLQRVAEDMEYTDLLDMAADRTDSTERLVYVAAFAASEYASTIGRVAKPFNPLLGETYEYVRPDKGYRFFIEQVSHHPPIGAAWAEAPKWDYYGESAVKSKFYGKSFDINPLGTWFLKLRPSSPAPNDAQEELYTWKKVTSSVVGIITGSPTVDNYGPMEIRNHTTGETCILDFKQRGWKASSAFQVTGKVADRDGNTRWTIGGRWNDKIYARLTPGYEGSVDPNSKDTNQAFLVWEAHGRPTGIPFNLTPFGVTLNALTDSLKRELPPTDTRLRPDQRAMEDGEYDYAATEKNRVEEKQRAKRRQREQHGEEFVPQWFRKATCPTTGEEFWEAIDGGDGAQYWANRARRDWKNCEDIF